MADVMNLVAWLVGVNMGVGFAWLDRKQRKLPPCSLCGHPGGSCG